MQLHVSELDAEGHHFSMSMASIYGMQRVAHYIDPKVPVIIESQVVAQLVEHEVEAAELALTGRVSNYVNGNSFAAIDLIR